MVSITFLPSTAKSLIPTSFSPPPFLPPFYSKCKKHAGLIFLYFAKKIKLRSSSNSLSSGCALCGWCSAQRALLFHGIELDPEWPFYNEWIENISLWNAACRHWLRLFFSSSTPPPHISAFDELKGQYPHPPHLHSNVWLSKDGRSITLPLLSRVYWRETQRKEKKKLPLSRLDSEAAKNPIPVLLFTA